MTNTGVIDGIPTVNGKTVGGIDDGFPWFISRGQVFKFSREGWLHLALDHKNEMLPQVVRDALKIDLGD